MDALTGAGLARYAGSRVLGLRLGVSAAIFEGCHPEVAAAVRQAIAELEAVGMEAVPVERPNTEDLALANAAGLVVSRCEAATFHRSIGTDLNRCWAETRDQLTAALETPAIEYVRALRSRAQLADQLADLLAEVDVLAMPTSLVPAPNVADAERYLMVLSRNCIPWSFVGFPAVSIPCRGRAEGLPVGLQLAAAP